VPGYPLKLLHAWLAEEEKISFDPTVRMKRPIVPEKAVPIVPKGALPRLADLEALGFLECCRG
jgi:hypothetical protein